MAATSTWVLHVDLDQFLAAVEVLRRPELRGRPVVVSASDDLSRRRTVVATAAYEAREHGIRSGMPMTTARRLCPDAVFLPSDRPAYEAASEEVMATLRSLPVVVEVLGWDEAFVGSGTDDPERLAADIQAAVASACQLTCAVGIGDNKLRAKIATGFAKPGGQRPGDRERGGHERRCLAGGPQRRQAVRRTLSMRPGCGRALKPG
jgi:DNA polymerase IV